MASIPSVVPEAYFHHGFSGGPTGVLQATLALEERRGRSRKSPHGGNSTAVTSLRASRFIQSSPVTSRWSALRAPRSYGGLYGSALGELVSGQSQVKAVFPAGSKVASGLCHQAFAGDCQRSSPRDQAPRAAPPR